VQYSGVSPAARAAAEVLADLAVTHDGGEDPPVLDRELVAYLVGLGRADKLAPVLTELQTIGYLTIYGAGLEQSAGRPRQLRNDHGWLLPDRFAVTLQPPAGYHGPSTLSESRAMFAQDRDEAYQAAREAGRRVRSGQVTIRRGNAADRSPCFLYVIGTPGSTTVKIGVTADLAGRLKQLQASSPRPLVVLWCARGGREIEDSLHARFYAQRVHGEWFDFGASSSPVPVIRRAALSLGAAEVTA
jgi:hypothetical protein